MSKSKIKHIQSNLSYLDQELLAKMDLYFWERECIKENMESILNEHKCLPLSINGEDYYINHEGKYVTLSEVNRRLLNTIERYRQEKNEDIENLKKNGAFLTGRSGYECYCLEQGGNSIADKLGAWK